MLDPGGKMQKQWALTTWPGGINLSSYPPPSPSMSRTRHTNVNRPKKKQSFHVNNFLKSYFFKCYKSFRWPSVTNGAMRSAAFQCQPLPMWRPCNIALKWSSEEIPENTQMLLTATTTTILNPSLVIVVLAWFPVTESRKAPTPLTHPLMTKAPYTHVYVYLVDHLLMKS